ncbi:MAG: TonB family protein [Kiritimatiellae bacterium]|nr:TonB family protein [Kiritimatiellia bacterium]
MAGTRFGIISVLGHVVVIGLLLSYASIKGCQMRRKPIEIKELTIAIDPFEEEAKPVEETKVEVPKTPPPPKPDDIALQKKPPPKKPDPPKKPEPKKPEPKKPEKPKIEKGKRVTRNPPPIKSMVKPKEKQTLTDEEIKKWLDKRVPIRAGETTSLPTSDYSLYLSIIKQSLYDAWDQPSREAAGTRPAEIAFELGAGGRILNPRVNKSSGSAAFDASALDAVRRTGSISGLSADFIRECGRGGIVIEFVLQ